MQTRSHPLFACVAATALLASTAYGHGFVPGRFTPPAVSTPGGSTPSAPGNPGTGGTTPGNPGNPGTGGATPGGPDFGGPVGGGSPNTGPVGGGTPGGFPVGGGSPGRPTGGSRPIGGPAGPGARGGTTPGGFRGGSMPTPRPKAKSEPWLDALTIDWSPEFLPASKTNDYATVVGTVEQAVRAAPENGGWKTFGRPAFVVVYDAADATQRREIDDLGKDARIRTASRFFSCFRVDAAPRSEGRDGMRFLVFDAKGASMGEVRGKARSSKIFDLMEKAYGGVDLGSACDAADALVKAVAQCEWTLKATSGMLACPDCGEKRDDVATIVRDHRAALADAESKLDGLVKSVTR